LNIENEKMNSALKEIAVYAAGYAKARAEAEASGSRFSSSVSRELKSALDASLTKILTPEQLAKWNELSALGKAK
jgi:Spy/CpxP family protein refolding chaperone